MRLTVAELRTVAAGVVELGLRAADGAPLPGWQPGAHIDLHLPGGIVRQYSLCGSPVDRATYRVAVLLAEPSRGGSAYIHTKLRVGDDLDATGPRNNFVFRPAERYLFVAGGIGITPILPMIEEAGAAGAQWSLLYGGRNRRSMAFTERVLATGGEVQLRPEDEYGLLDLDSWLASVDDRTLVYCCGPEALLAAVEARADRWGQGTLHLERFTPTAAPAPAANRSFRVTCARSGTAVDVPAGLSVLGALRAAGVDVESSCEEGVCGTCETKVLSGVPDHRDSILTAAERQAGTQMMICVSRSESDELVLDL